jgi:hypothetical protein
MSAISRSLAVLAVVATLAVARCGNSSNAVTAPVEFSVTPSPRPAVPPTPVKRGMSAGTAASTG